MRYNHGIIINDFSSPVLSICWMNPRGQAFNFIFLYDYFTRPAENQCQLRYWIDANSVALFDYGIWHLLFNDRLRDPVCADCISTSSCKRTLGAPQVIESSEIWIGVLLVALCNNRPTCFFFFLVFQSSFCRNNFSPFFVWFFLLRKLGFGTENQAAIKSAGYGGPLTFDFIWAL